MRGLLHPSSPPASSPHRLPPHRLPPHRLIASSFLTPGCQDTKILTGKGVNVSMCSRAIGKHLASPPCHQSIRAFVAPFMDGYRAAPHASRLGIPVGAAAGCHRMATGVRLPRLRPYFSAGGSVAYRLWYNEVAVVSSISVMAVLCSSSTGRMRMPPSISSTRARRPMPASAR